MFHDQVAIITGASRGIGRAIARRLHQEGLDLALVARSAEQLAAVKEEIAQGPGRGRVMVLPADVTSPAAAREAVAACEAQLGDVDLLINNAGTVEQGEHRLWEADVDEWWSVITTNLRGPMLWCSAVIPGMKARGRGRIINLNSMRGVRVLPTQTAYGVSKAALAKLTETLAVSLAGSGVHAFGYSPGRVKTDLTQSLGGLAAAAPSSWTPMERAVDGLMTIARGELDELAGHFLHAHDDWQRLIDNVEGILSRQGRTLVLSPAYADDPLPAREVGR